MSVYVYVRQSSGSEERSVSCEQQEENCIQFASKHSMTVDKVFSDLNTSGRLYCRQFASLAEIDLVYKKWVKETNKVNKFREGLSSLFDILKQDDTIVIDELTRLFRPLTNSYLESALTQFLVERNIRLLTVKNGEVNLNNFNDNLITSLQNRINTEQLEKQRRKSKDSLTRMKRNGESFQSIGRIIGYQYTGRKYEVEINKRGAEAVKFVFKSFIEGANLLKITRDLSKDYGDVFRNGYTSTANVRKMLSRSLYAGYIEMKDGSFVKSKQVEGKEIIDWNTFKLARDLLNKRKTNKIIIKHRNENFHFTGMVFCGYCGHKLNTCIIGKKNYHSMRCKNKYVNCQIDCKNSISIDTPYQHGLNLNQAVEPLLVIGLLKKLNESNNNSIGEELKEKKIELENIISSEKKLTDLFLKGLLEESVLEQRLSEQKAIKTSIHQQIIDLETSLSNNEDNEKLRKLIRTIFNHKLTVQQYNELVARTIKQMILYKEKLVVETIEGKVEIPRFTERGILRLPNYTFVTNPEHIKLYYYTKTFNIYSKQTKLLDLPYFKIYMQEETK